MFCRKCGRLIADGSQYCSNCGAKAEMDAPVVDKPKEKWPYPFRSQWRNATGSTLFVIAAICFTIFQIVLLFNVFTISDMMLADWKELDVVQYINEFVHNDELTKQMKSVDFWVGASKFLLIVSGFVSVIGIWSVYADSKNDPMVSFDDGIFLWLKVSQIIRSIGAVVAMLIYNSIASNIKSFYSGDNSFGILNFVAENRIEAINDGLGLLCAPYWILVVYTIAMFVVVHKLQDMAVSGIPQTGTIIFAAVVIAVAAVALAFVASLWSALIGFCSVFLIIQHPVMEKMEREYDEVRYKKSERGGDDPIPVGGWKCSCGRANAGYVSSCSCGKNKREIVQN